MDVTFIKVKYSDVSLIKIYEEVKKLRKFEHLQMDCNNSSYVNVGFVITHPRGGRLLVNCVPMREQRTAKLNLNSVFAILKLISLFTVSSQKVTLSNVVSFKTLTLLLLQPLYVALIQLL